MFNKNKALMVSIVIILIMIILAFFSTKLSHRLSGTGFEINGENQQVLTQLNQDFKIPKQTVYLVFDNVSDEGIDKTLFQIKQLIKTKDILSPLDYPNQKNHQFAYALLLFDTDEVATTQQLEKIMPLINKNNKIMLTGQVPANMAINDSSQQDLEKAELIGIPIAFIILVIAFGSLLAALIPIIIGLVTILSTFGILYLTHQHDYLSIYVLNIVPMIGLALSIDFCLLFINRYKQERSYLSDIQAIKVTMKTSGEAIMFSALCVAIGLSALSLINIPLFKDLAIGAAIVIICALFYVLIFLPCILLILGNKINVGSLQWLYKSKKPSNFWYQISGKIMQHPIKITITTMLLLIMALLPIKNMSLILPAEKSLPATHQIRIAQNILLNQFNIDDDKILYLLIDNDKKWEFNHADLQKIQNLQQQLQKDSMINHVTTIYTLLNVTHSEQVLSSQLKPTAQSLFYKYVKDNKLLIPITLYQSSDDELTRQWVNHFTISHMTKAGAVQFKTEIFNEIKHHLLSALFLIFGATFVILSIVFRSIILPIKAIVMNILSLSATFGLLIWLFQQGHLGLPTAPLALVIPIIIFSLVFGLSMDYEVFLISSIKEHYYNGMNNQLATQHGLAQTSKIITSAALIMIVVTGAFAFTSIIPVKQLGVGIALAIFIDATIIRLLLVPSLMQLMGDWNWWYPFKK